ncbi:MAG: PQQ-dependent sugar dehydrogenase [Planctomycetes bacterium]|nr:PQQ-dependent sugar dehydrogenase [Planctomycetota bacterium]
MRTGTSAVALLAILLACGSVAAQTFPSGFSHQTLAGGFDQPVGMAFLPDGRILVVEQRTARVKVFAGGLVGTLGTIPGVNAAGNEQGLLGVAVDPSWPGRPHLYFHHNASNPARIQIVMYSVTGDLTTPSSTNLALDKPFLLLHDIPDNATNHNGGTCRFGPDGMLYVSLGDDASPCAAQDITDLRGTILRLDVSGMPGPGSGPPAKSAITPADNPFRGPNDNARLYWAYGLRNPFRFTIDPATGNLYIGDVGQSQYEELDESTGGENFGWPWFEGPVRFSSCGGGSPPPSVPPIASYPNGSGAASIVPFTIYRNRLGGTANLGNAYEGNVFFSDYYQGFVRRLVKNGSTWSPAPPVPGQPTSENWADTVDNVDALVGPDGAIYYLKQFPGELNRVAFHPQLPQIEAPSTVSAGQPLLVRCQRNPGDTILLALGLSMIPPTPLPGYFGFVEIIGGPLALGVADANGNFDVILSIPANAAGITGHFQCVAVAGVDNFISPKKSVTVVP